MTEMTMLRPGDSFPALTMALPPQDVIGLVGYLRDHAQASATPGN